MSNSFYQPFDEECVDGPRPPDKIRSPFQVDRDRVTFTEAFRRLQSKTQVFQSGEYDFYRTRLTHSIEVARIGRSICEYLRAQEDPLGPDFYIDPDLAEALGLAHDIGHPPFGHIGERKLNELMRGHGGFEGNAQTLRIITTLIYERPGRPRGMNPSRAFLDGILKYKALHSEMTAKDPENTPPENHFLYDSQARYRDCVFGHQPLPDDLSAPAALNAFKSLECRIMDWSDDTAYSLHDILDGIKAGFITAKQIEHWAEKQELTPSETAHIDNLLEVMGKDSLEAVFSNKIGDFIRACSLQECDNFMASTTHRYRYTLVIDPAVCEECSLYKKIALDLIFRSPQIQQLEFKGGYFLERLFEAFYDHYAAGNGRSLKILPHNVSSWIASEETETGRIRRICDHLASLTDGQALRAYKRLFDPDFGSILDLA